MVAALVVEVEGAGLEAGGAVLAGVSAPVVVAAEAAEVAGALGGGLLGESAEVAAPVADVTVELAADVTEEVVDVTAEVSVLVTGEAAEPEVVAAAGAVAACACRENTSKTSRIPAASIAHCAARRAARRKASCGIGGSPPRETGPDTTAHL